MSTRTSFVLTVACLFLMAACRSPNEEAATPAPTVRPTPSPLPVDTASNDQTTTAVPAPPYAAVLVDDPGPALTELSQGWTKVEPGGDTRCAHDTPFAYWVKAGTTNKLLVYFEGGGGCWDAATCAPGSNFYDPDVGADEDPTFRNGVFKLDHPDNPFRNYTAVYIPSCGGDVYWGNSVQDYPTADGDSRRIYHRGFVNAAAALAWAYAQVSAPESVFVTGCSAGSVGSRVHAPYIIAQYPEAQVAQLGDSLAFVFGRPVRLGDYNAYQTFPDWIPELETLKGGDGFLMAAYDTIIANEYPETTFAQYNTENDNVQVRFYTAVSGLDAAGFRQDLATHLSAIHASAANFRSFTSEGDLHCILPHAQFYDLETNGVPLVTWVQALATGVDVPNVQCTSCQVELSSP